MITGYDLMRKYAVTDVTSVEEFLARYCKRERYTGRGEERARSMLQSYQQEFEQDGYCMMSHHNSVTGEIVAFYG